MRCVCACVCDLMCDVVRCFLLCVALCLCGLGVLSVGVCCLCVVV